MKGAMCFAYCALRTAPGCARDALQLLPGRSSAGACASASSLDLGADSFDQGAPMLEVALNELADILRREVDPLEAVIAEELRGLGMIQRLGNISMNLRKKIGRHFSRPP